MIHYHGTPITPRAVLDTMAGFHFCVSFAEPRDDDTVMRIGQSVLWDNGAFSAFTIGKAFDPARFYEWLDPRLHHPHRAVVPDVIGGSVEEQRALRDAWPFPRDLGWPVWHLDKPLDELDRIADEWPGLCLGSAGAYWKIGTPAWRRRMDEAFETLHRRRVMPWLHGLRMLGQVNGRWPLASADSANVARHHAEVGCAVCMARRIDAQQPAQRWNGEEQHCLPL